MQPIYVTKVLAAASSTSIGTFSSGGTITLSCATLDTGRRIILWGSTGTGTVTISGLSETGTPISETIIGSTIGSVVSSVQDFIKVTGISLPSAGVASTAGYLGTSTNGGTPWQVVDTFRNPINLGFNITPTTTGIQASLEYTMDYPSYNPQLSQWRNPYTTNGPQPTISSLGSSVFGAANGYITTPIAAWRITLSSSSSSAGTANAIVIQSG